MELLEYQRLSVSFRKIFSYFENGKSKHCLYENVFDRVFDEISNNMHVSKLFVCGSLVIDLERL